MNKKEKEEALNYFAKVFGNKDGNYGGKIRKGTHCFDFPTKECKLLGIRRAFGDGSDWIKCSQYEAVISGEGDEEEKIDSAFSSSLQSLLFFAKTEEKGVKIRFDDGSKHTFTRVIFEYKNQVIKGRFPASVDVVLTNPETKEICFVESKLLEIVRESKKKGTSVVGVSYFKDKHAGYNKTLGLTKEDLAALRISEPENGTTKKQAIEPLREGSFVYSDGIKQVLSHLIGIAQFKHGQTAYKGDDPLPPDKRHFEKIYYLELYNALPGFDGDEKAIDKLKNFEDHFKAVRDVVMNKDQRPVTGMYIMTYQKLFKQNKGLVNDVIRDYYHLDGK